MSKAESFGDANLFHVTGLFLYLLKTGGIEKDQWHDSKTGLH